MNPLFSDTVAPFFPQRATILRRALFFTTVVLTNLAATWWLVDLCERISFQKAHYLVIVVFFVLNGMLCLGSAHAFFGFFDIVRGRRRAVRITRLAEGLDGPLTQRHAVVMPVYNEDSVKTCARIEAIYRSIKATGHLDSFDFFILSDTRDLDLWVLEETAWTNLSRRLDGFGRIYYRRRVKNENRKAGNIGDFIRTWGGNYESMLVLDADSLMDGADIVTMTRVMEKYPRLGILQTPPRLIRGSSVFTRLQQFAMRLYGPLFIRGLNFWQLAGGSYWGHNALIRIKPFSEFCELPALPGKEPFGGRILSHDFVEAALMTAEGWEVWLAWDIGGTYEEAPPTLVDHLVRDRRWMQGNLQHMWLVFARKFPFPARMHLLMGIMAYLCSPIWFVFLLLTTWVAWDRAHSGLSQLPYDESRVARFFDLTGTQQSAALAIFVFSLLFLPKILAALHAIFSADRRQSFGGALRVTVGTLLEFFISILLAPCFMATHATMVAGFLLGRKVTWETQNRETDGTAWSDAFRFHLFPTVLGIVWAWVAWNIGPSFLAWISPILLGLVFSAPVSVLTSRTRYGRALARHGILSTPEERDVPQVIQLADAATAAIDPALDASAPLRRGVVAAVVDPYVNSVHISLLEPSEASDHDQALAELCLRKGPGAIDKNDLSRLLYLAPCMLMMHRAVWLRPSGELHAIWATAVESYRGREDLAMNA